MTLCFFATSLQEYDNDDGTDGYRIFEDDSYAPKAFEQEGVVLK